MSSTEFVIDVEKDLAGKVAAGKVVALCKNTPAYTRGRLICANEKYIVYSVRGTGLRFLHRKSGETALIENAADRMVDMVFPGGSEGTENHLVFATERGGIMVAEMRVDPSQPADRRFVVEVSEGFASPAQPSILCHREHLSDRHTPTQHRLADETERDPFVRVVAVPANPSWVLACTKAGRVYLFECMQSVLVLINSNEESVLASSKEAEEALASAGEVRDLSVALDVSLCVAAFSSGRCDLFRLPSLERVRQAFVSSSLSPSDRQALCLCRFVCKGTNEYLLVGFENNMELGILNWRSSIVSRRLLLKERSSMPSGGGPSTPSGFAIEVDPETCFVAACSLRHPILLAVPLTNDMGREPGLRFGDVSPLHVSNPILSLFFFAKTAAGAAGDQTPSQASPLAASAAESSGRPGKKMAVFCVTAKNIEFLPLNVREHAIFGGSLLGSLPGTPVAGASSSAPVPPLPLPQPMAPVSPMGAVHSVPGGGLLPSMPPHGHMMSFPPYPPPPPASLAPLPGVPSMVDPKFIAGALHQSIHDGLAAMDISSMVHDAMRAQMNDTVRDVLVRELQPKLVDELRLGFREHFANVLVPAIETSVKNMLSQISSALRGGLQAEFSSFAAQARADLQETVVEQMRVVQTSLEDSVSAAVERQSQAVMRGVVQAVSETVAPLARVENKEKVKSSIGVLLEARNFEKAFKDSLKTSDLSIVVWLCERLKTSSSETCSLLPASILLSLTQQLSFDLSTDIPLKISWMQDALTALNFDSDKRLAVRALPVLTMALTALKSAEHVALAAGSETARTYRLLTKLLPALIDQASSAMTAPSPSA